MAAEEEQAHAATVPTLNLAGRLEEVRQTNVGRFGASGGNVW